MACSSSESKNHSWWQQTKHEATTKHKTPHIITEYFQSEPKLVFESLKANLFLKTTAYFVGIFCYAM